MVFYDDVRSFLQIFCICVSVIEWLLPNSEKRLRIVYDSTCFEENMCEEEKKEKFFMILHNEGTVLSLSLW